MTPGLHRLTARVIALNGQNGSDTVVASVLPAPIPPAALVRSWQRTINTANAPAIGSQLVGWQPTRTVDSDTRPAAAPSARGGPSTSGATGPGGYDAPPVSRV